MIIKKAQVMPHALINNVPEKLGYDVEILKNYVEWLRNRIIKIRNNDNYSPVIHIDVYRTLGTIFGNDNYEGIVKYLGELEKVASPFKLRIEGHVDVEDREKQMLAKPGIGVDESYMIVFNEMQRILALKNIFNK